MKTFAAVVIAMLCAWAGALAGRYQQKQVDIAVGALEVSILETACQQSLDHERALTQRQLDVCEARGEAMLAAAELRP